MAKVKEAKKLKTFYVEVKRSTYAYYEVKAPTRHDALEADYDSGYIGYVDGVDGIVSGVLTERPRVDGV